MSKLGLIAILVTLIGATSCIRWCDNFKYQLDKMSTEMEISWSLETIIDYLIAVKHPEEAEKAREYLRSLKSVRFDVTTSMEAKEKTKSFLKNCDEFSTQWKRSIEEKFFAANTTTELAAMVEEIALFVEILF
ncbi:uncharacterized protein LOC141854895 [Brevipalpus obovatus]|uniref:uncharacterized protein LOC141854895 n=1 Tax=Brevipalpus obovatus TaxID=246614 RepID=UPI003D9DEB98